MKIDQTAVHRVMMAQCDEGTPDVAYKRLNIDSGPLIDEFVAVYGPIGELIVGFIGVGVDLGIELERSKQQEGVKHPDPETDHGHEDEFLASLPEAHGFGMGI